jgi:ankyrin repeat protein
VHRTGQTALNLAARHGHAEIVTLLLEAAAEPDHADVDGWTALRYLTSLKIHAGTCKQFICARRSAAWGGHVTTVDVLLKRGADVERADAEGRTALRAAAWGNFPFNWPFA